MNDSDPFDAMLDRPKVRAKTSVANSAPYVVDMLELAWAGSRSVFGNAAKPEQALMLLPHLLAAAAAERQLLQDEIAARTLAESGPRPSTRRAPTKRR